jgi:hypothetical protein
MLLCVRLHGRWSARGGARRGGAPCVVAARVAGGEDDGRAWREAHLRPAHKGAGRPPLPAWACGARARRGRRRRGRGPQGHRCDFADGRHAVVARPRWLGPRAAARRRRRGGGVGRRARRIGVLQAGVSGAGNGSSGGVLGMRGSDTRDNGSDRAGDAMATRRGCNGSNGRGACARRSWRSSTCATMCTWPNEWLQRVRQMGPPQPF